MQVHPGKRLGKPKSLPFERVTGKSQPGLSAWLLNGLGDDAIKQKMHVGKHGKHHDPKYFHVSARPVGQSYIEPGEPQPTPWLFLWSQSSFLHLLLNDYIRWERMYIYCRYVHICIYIFIDYTIGLSFDIMIVIIVRITIILIILFVTIKSQHISAIDSLMQIWDTNEIFELHLFTWGLMNQRCGSWASWPVQTLYCSATGREEWPNARSPGLDVD